MKPKRKRIWILEVLTEVCKILLIIFLFIFILTGFIIDAFYFEWQLLKEKNPKIINSLFWDKKECKNIGRRLD